MRRHEETRKLKKAKQKNSEAPLGELARSGLLFRFTTPRFRLLRDVDTAVLRFSPLFPPSLSDSGQDSSCCP